MKKFLHIALSLLLLIAGTACHDESEELKDPSILEMVKLGKKRPKMVYSTGEKKERLSSVGDNPEQENNEKLEVTFEVEGADLHLHLEGFMEDAYLFVQDGNNKIIFTQNVALIDEQHPLDITIAQAEDYPYFVQVESEKYIAKIHITLE